MELDDETLRDYSSLHMVLIHANHPVLNGYIFASWVSAFKEVKKNLEWAQYKNGENSVLGGLFYHPLADASSKDHAKHFIKFRMLLK